MLVFSGDLVDVCVFITAGPITKLFADVAVWGNVPCVSKDITGLI